MNQLIEPHAISGLTEKSMALSLIDLAGDGDISVPVCISKPVSAKGLIMKIREMPGDA
jgi:hypothetical protein